MNHYRLFIDGQWIDTPAKKDVINKYTLQPFATVAQADESLVAQAVKAARKTFNSIKLSPYQRYEILTKASQLIVANKDMLGVTICRETGKPIKEARNEVDRAFYTMQASAEEAKRINGRMVPIESNVGSENRLAFTLRIPVGIVCAITPFNFPLNLVVHKIAPAIAAGNTVVLKPTQETPVSSALLVDILIQAGLPAGFINLVFGSGGTVGEWLLKNTDINFYSLTGSPPVGEHIKNSIGLRKATMELGSNAAVIVHHDAKDIKKIGEACMQKSLSNNGQACISVQRVYAHEKIFDELLQAMKAYAEKMVLGDPMDEKVTLGPMINPKEVDRIDQWVQEALNQGARLITGGKKRGANFFEPTILTNVSPEMKVVRQEVFAPLVVVNSYQDPNEAIASTNNTVYGLQSSIFTSDLNLAMRAAREIETGGVIINDTSLYRADSMPYGGVKQSGNGKEGPKYAIEDMTEEKLVVFNL